MYSARTLETMQVYAAIVVEPSTLRLRNRIEPTRLLYCRHSTALQSTWCSCCINAERVVLLQFKSLGAVVGLYFCPLQVWYIL